MDGGKGIYSSAIVTVQYGPVQCSQYLLNLECWLFFCISNLLVSILVVWLVPDGYYLSMASIIHGLTFWSPHPCSRCSLRWLELELELDVLRTLWLVLAVLNRTRLFIIIVHQSSPIDWLIAIYRLYSISPCLSEWRLIDPFWMDIVCSVYGWHWHRYWHWHCTGGIGTSIGTGADIGTGLGITDMRQILIAARIIRKNEALFSRDPEEEKKVIPCFHLYTLASHGREGVTPCWTLALSSVLRTVLCCAVLSRLHFPPHVVNIQRWCLQGISLYVGTRESGVFLLTIRIILWNFDVIFLGAGC